MTTWKRIPVLGVSLIVVGAAMLLQRLDVFSIEWQTIAWALVALFGLSRVINGFAGRSKGSAFWGSLLFLLGLYKVLVRIDLLIIEPYLTIPVIITAVGVGFLTMYLSSPGEWHILVPACVFLGLGGVMIMTEVGYFDRWDVVPVVNTYWPVALILFGVSLLLSRRSSQNGLHAHHEGGTFH